MPLSPDPVRCFPPCCIPALGQRVILIVLERDGIKESGQLSNAPVQVIGFCHSTQPQSNLVKV
jgi:hypothetical protein